MKPKLLKVAWVRQSDAPIGQSAPGQLQCACGNAPLTHYQPGPDVICNCGRRYTWDGCIKGRSEYSDTLTAYQVVLANGTSHFTDMAAEVTLAAAYRYFVGREVNGQMAVDVNPIFPEQKEVTNHA